MTKMCFKCGEIKELSMFYIHPGTADGHLGKCKDCTKKDVRNRFHNPANLEKIRSYEKARNQTQSRKQKKRDYDRANPARLMVYKKTSNGIRDGRLVPQPCAVCGEVKTEAHHSDYTLWNKVTWLCRKHHMETHGRRYWNGE